MSPPPTRTQSKPDPATTFFEDLNSKGHELLLHHASGSLRLDLQDGDAIEHWYLTMDKGDVSVSHRKVKADVTIRMDRKLFEGMARGAVNLTTCFLRGLLEVEGNLGLLGDFDRLIPGPKASRNSFLKRQEELAG